LDFKHTYNVNELELIKNYLKVHPNYEIVDDKLNIIPYAPIAVEAIVHEISRQLGNWNLKNNEKGTMGIVTTPKGGFDFDVNDGQKIRAPNVAFTPGDAYISLNEQQLWSFQGQFFTPIFVVEVAILNTKDAEKKIDNKIKMDYFARGTSVKLGWLLDPINCIIWVYKRDKHGNPFRRSRKWEDLNGGDILPDFTLELERIDEIATQVMIYKS